MTIKTLDEYVLKELQDTKEQLELAKEEILKLKEEMSARAGKVETPLDEKIYKISETPQYFYIVNAISNYKINELLIANNKTPEYLKDVLTNNEKYINFCKMKYENYGTTYGGIVERRTYEMRITNYYGKIAVLYTSYDHKTDVININNECYFLDEDLANSKLAEMVHSSIKSYFEYKYDEKFEELRKAKIEKSK